MQTLRSAAFKAENLLSWFEILVRETRLDIRYQFGGGGLPAEDLDLEVD